MRPKTLSVTGVGASPVVPLDFMNDDFEVGIGVAVSGTVTYTVEHTFDDPYAADFTAAGATWLPTANLDGNSASASAKLDVRARAVRLNVTAGTGTASMTIISGR